MKVKIKRDILVKALKKISGVVSLGRRTHFRAAHYVLVETKSNGVSLTATDLSVNIRVTVEAEIVQEGSVALAGQKLLEYVELLGDDVVVIKDDKIICGNASSKFHSIPVDEYPEFPLEETDFVSMKSDDLKEIIRQTVFAAGTDDCRPNLEGVCFEKNESFLRLIGTNGRRLAISQAGYCEKASAIDNDGGVIIPRKTLKEIARISDDGDKSIQIGIAGDKAIFKTYDTILIAQLIDGQFPDYHRVVKGNDEREIIAMGISKKQLLRSLSRIKVIARNAADGRMSITRDNNHLILKSDTLNGSVSDEVEITEGSAEDSSEDSNDAFEISLNHSYLFDAVNAVVSDTVQLEVCGGNVPLVVKGDGR
ncbi:MAG: DNA polymerase III subunit beta, partial [Deltaproteobacteria bacterium]|nr:DNA polymerase III subunit beta [Deltaproteobacteria bacterium]